MLITTHRKLPVTGARSLAGSDLILPRQLNHELNLLIIGSYSWQEPLIDAWFRQSTRISGRYEDFDVYECHLSPERADEYTEDRRHEQWHGNASYRQRQKIMALRTPRSTFLRQIHISNDRQVHALLVDRAGDILWHAQGQPAPAKILQLEGLVHYLLVIQQV